MPKKTIPSEEEILAYDNVPVEKAAPFIGWSTTTIYRALQDQCVPFGMAVKCEGHWAYNISPGALVKYKRGELSACRMKDLEKQLGDAVERIADEKTKGIQRVLELLTEKPLNGVGGL